MTSTEGSVILPAGGKIFRTVKLLQLRGLPIVVAFKYFFILKIKEILGLLLLGEVDSYSIFFFPLISLCLF